MLQWVVIEAVIVAAMAAIARGQGVAQSLRMRLGFRVNVMILEKALTLGCPLRGTSGLLRQAHPRTHGGQRAAAVMVMRSFGLVQNAISLASFAVLLAAFSPWAPAVLLLAGLPAFVAETKFSGRRVPALMRWRSPERRKQLYLEA
ncbi:MAG: hypothetical protein U0168_28575 [Nannocystaceae bacterium]